MAGSRVVVDAADAGKLFAAGYSVTKGAMAVGYATVTGYEVTLGTGTLAAFVLPGDCLLRWKVVQPSPAPGPAWALHAPQRCSTLSEVSAAAVNSMSTRVKQPCPNERMI
ncbi:hypothetical protein CHU95_03875 [Niveispirillum lacus]|uniref:Uncharacterized protein n=1 Tax=Niveispirillum lacus TaxID=1981099 RepID=A0A255Z5A0_9PROT|nr:hypothetical protein CHU95_03875 [Niveispirillum lacus]